VTIGIAVFLAQLRPESQWAAEGCRDSTAYLGNNSGISIGGLELWVCGWIQLRRYICAVAPLPASRPCSRKWWPLPPGVGRCWGSANGFQVLRAWPALPGPDRNKAPAFLCEPRRGMSTEPCPLAAGLCRPGGRSIYRSPMAKGSTDGGRKLAELEENGGTDGAALPSAIPMGSIGKCRRPCNPAGTFWV